MLLKLHSARARQPGIEKQAACPVITPALPECLSGRKLFSRNAYRVEQIRQPFANRSIIIDDEDGLSHYAVTFNVKQKRAPMGSRLSTQMRPSCASMMLRQIASPMPVPCSLVLKKGSNI